MPHARVKVRRTAAVICVAALAAGTGVLSAASAGADTTTQTSTTAPTGTATTGTGTGTTGTGTTTTGTTTTRTTPRGASVTSGARCYQVGQHVSLRGTGFLDAAPYDIAVDGVDFGQSVTSARGTFSASLIPGGLGAGQAQLTDTLNVSDGSSSVNTEVTLTRRTGALYGSGTGSSARRKVPFEVWDFAPTGPAATVYLHYVSPAGKARSTVSLGTAGGQCGYLRSAARQLFPFNPSAGTWTLQFDTTRAYTARPKGRVARISVQIG